MAAVKVSIDAVKQLPAYALLTAAERAAFAAHFDAERFGAFKLRDLTVEDLRAVAYQGRAEKLVKPKPPAVPGIDAPKASRGAVQLARASTEHQRLQRLMEILDDVALKLATPPAAPQVVRRHDSDPIPLVDSVLYIEELDRLLREVSGLEAECPGFVTRLSDADANRLMETLLVGRSFMAIQLENTQEWAKSEHDVAAASFRKSAKAAREAEAARLDDVVKAHSGRVRAIDALYGEFHAARLKKSPDEEAVEHALRVISAARRYHDGPASRPRSETWNTKVFFTATLTSDEISQIARALDGAHRAMRKVEPQRASSLLDAIDRLKAKLDQYLAHSLDQTRRSDPRATIAPAAAAEIDELRLAIGRVENSAAR